jgi:hypothetical protein
MDEAGRLAAYLDPHSRTVTPPRPFRDPGPSPNDGTSSVLTSAPTAPGDQIVQAVGYDGAEGSWNPLAMQNG